MQRGAGEQRKRLLLGLFLTDEDVLLTHLNIFPQDATSCFFLTLPVFNRVSTVVFPLSSVPEASADPVSIQTSELKLKLQRGPSPEISF